MAWTDPVTWGVGATPNDAFMNTHVRDNFRETWHEIFYREFVTDVGYAAGGTQIVTSDAVTYAALPILIEFFARGWTTASGSSGDSIVLFDGASSVITLAAYPGAASALTVPSVFVARRLTPTAASHTYLVKGVGTSGGVVKALGFLRISQKGGV